MTMQLKRACPDAIGVQDDNAAETSLSWRQARVQNDFQCHSALDAESIYA